MLLEILKVSRTKPLDSSDNGCDDNKRGNVAAGRLWVWARVPSNEDSNYYGSSAQIVSSDSTKLMEFFFLLRF